MVDMVLHITYSSIYYTCNNNSDNILLPTYGNWLGTVVHVHVII